MKALFTLSVGELLLILPALLNSEEIVQLLFNLSYQKLSYRNLSFQAYARFGMLRSERQTEPVTERYTKALKQ